MRRGRNVHDTRRGFPITPTDNDFISHLYHVSRFHRPPIEQNKARIAKLLSHRATRAKTAGFKKNIESHVRQTSVCRCLPALVSHDGLRFVRLGSWQDSENLALLFLRRLLVVGALFVDLVSF